MNWYYGINGQQQGPVSEAEIIQLVQAGTLSATTLIWREGLPDWQPLSVALPQALSSSITSAEPPPTTEVAGIAVPMEQKDTYVQQLREGVTISSGMEYAGFWIRFVAKFIDGVVQQILFYTAAFLLSLVGVTLMPEIESMLPKDGTPPSEEQMAGFMSVLGVMMLIGFGFQVTYHGFMVGKFGATLGKMAVNIKVVNPDGSSLSMGKAFGRAFAEIVTGFTCVIGYIIAAFDTHKRSLHDHIASTRVITKR
jgi:uncharacterized RDD family membrane protein YckC